MIHYSNEYFIYFFMTILSHSIPHAAYSAQFNFLKKCQKTLIGVMTIPDFFSFSQATTTLLIKSSNIMHFNPIVIIFISILIQKSEEMQSMVNRWRDKLTSIQQKQSVVSNPGAFPPKPENLQNESNIAGHTNAHINSNTITNSHTSLNMKKSLQKSKRSVHAYDQRQKEKVSNSKRITTPSKKVQKNKKTKYIQKACQDIFEIFAKATPTDKTTSSKIRNTLQELWARSAQFHSQPMSSPVQKISSYTNLEQQTSIMRQSSLSGTGISQRKQEKLYQDLEKKYFEIEKQKQYYKSRIDEMIKKYENIDKELEQYHKMQKLIDKCIERQQQMRQENKALRNSLKQNQLKVLEQQKIFESQIHIVRELVDEIKKNLPLTHT